MTVKERTKEFRNINSLSDFVNTNKFIKLNWNDDIINFSFHAINYTLPEKAQYRYKLIGLETEEEYIITSENTTRYTNLGPGEYQFHVQASNNDGVWNEVGAYINFEIKTPLWQRSWFALVIIALIVLLVTLLFRYRSRLLIQEKIRLQKRVEERTHLIAQQNLELQKQKQDLKEA